MAGTFAHMVLVRTLCKPQVLDGIATLTPAMRNALSAEKKYCELGAVSPDYPLLCLDHQATQAWGDVMHYWRTADVVRHAIPLVWNRDFREKVGAPQAIAWLFGYTAHLITDLTIHPVVNILVNGSYAEKKTAHRICEMHQDVFIFNEFGLGNFVLARYIKDFGVGACDINLVADIWTNALSVTPRTLIQMKDGAKKPTTPPDPCLWQRHFADLIDHTLAAGEALPKLLRWGTGIAGLTYPEYAAIDPKYTQCLVGPNGKATNYRRVFEHARQQTILAWTRLGEALDKNKPELFDLPNGDLDTGCADDNKQLICW